MIENRADFALITAIKGLEYLEKFFKIPFPLEKQGRSFFFEMVCFLTILSSLDLIALDDFAEGAMENWGLITFRDSLLLYVENRSTTRTKEAVATVIVHELAHQVPNVTIFGGWPHFSTN